MLQISDTLELIKLAQEGNEQAKEKLVVENSPLIKSVIKRYKCKGTEYEDLYQLGSLGFLKAINNFSDEFGVKFSTYAVPMIAGEVKRFLRDNGIIKVSRGTKSLGVAINKYIDDYTAKNERSPSVDIIAKKFEISPQDVVFAMESSKMPISLFTPMGQDDDDRQQELIDRVSSNDYGNRDFDTFSLMKTIKNLSPRDRKIILLRYFRDKTQSEIAKDMGVSQVQISRLENRIIQNIKSNLR